MSSDADPPPRKLLKPLLEKLRRERLNRSLERLRLLLLEGTGDQRLRNPKVEKAEILQKTVQFLRARPGPEPSAPEELEELLVRRYRSGYRACLARAARFLRDVPIAACAAAPAPGDGAGGPGHPHNGGRGPPCHGDGCGGHHGGGLGLSLGTQRDPGGGTGSGLGRVLNGDPSCVPGHVPSRGLHRGVGHVSTHGLGCVLSSDPNHGLGCVLSGDPNHVPGPGLGPGLGHVTSDDPNHVLSHGLGCVLSGDPTHGLGHVRDEVPAHGLGHVPGGGPGPVPSRGLGHVPGGGPGPVPARGLGHVPSPVPNPVPEASCPPRSKGDLEGLPGPPQHVWRPWP